jgi:transposase
MAAGRDPARVVFETSTGAFRLASIAQQHGHDVRVVAATLVRSLAVGQRGLKNDVRDARMLSEASRRIDLPSVHIPTVISQEVKAICVSRESLIRMRTQLVNRVRSYVRSRLGRESGKLYLAAILDLFSRFVVGWAVSAVNDRHLALKALGVALKRRCPDVGLLHHSDPGLHVRE